MGYEPAYAVAGSGSLTTSLPGKGL